MKSVALRLLAILVVLPSGLPAQNPGDIPPPLVTEPTPIPLPAETPPPPTTATATGTASEASLIRPRSAPEMQALIPTLRVTDMQKALDFYTTKLGFSILLREGSTYTAIGRDAVQIGLALVASLPKSGYGSCYIKISLVDVFYQTVQDRKVTPSEKLQTKASKMREFSVQDPDGNVLTFGQYTGG